MFKWFLKLIGIDEDRPVSNSSLLSASEAQSQVQKKTPPVVKQESSTAKKQESSTVAKQESSTASKKESKQKPAPKTKSKQEKSSLNDDYPDLKSNLVKTLTAAGFSTKSAIDKAKDKELLALKGIGKATIKLLRK